MSLYQVRNLQVVIVIRVRIILRISANWKHPEFFIPEKLRWPVLIIAVLAAVVGSQAIITGTFSIIKQCSALGCFPRVKIVHTSSKFHGQIYIPEINWILMILCLAVTIGFRDTRRLGNASGMLFFSNYLTIDVPGFLFRTCPSIVKPERIRQNNLLNNSSRDLSVVIFDIEFYVRCSMS